MIKKLESAGLGYRVRADETTERIGKVDHLFAMMLMMLEHFRLENVQCSISIFFSYLTRLIAF